MILKVKWGLGSPGKLWTGDSPQDGSLVDANLFLKKCSACGQAGRRTTTKILRTKEVGMSPQALEALEVSTLFITAGGVGSIYSQAVDIGLDSELGANIRCWNWSERISGHAILDPLAVVGGYVTKASLPMAKPGYVWVETYRGSTLSEFVLLHKDLSRHRLPEVLLDRRTCPPCRKQMEIDSVPEDLVLQAGVSLEACGLTAEEAGRLWRQVTELSDYQVGETFSAKAFVSWIHTCCNRDSTDLADKIRQAIAIALGTNRGPLRD